MLLIDSGSGRIIDANPAAVAFYGWPLPILVSLHITDIDNSPPDEIRTRLKKSVNENIHITLRNTGRIPESLRMSKYTWARSSLTAKPSYTLLFMTSPSVLRQPCAA